MYFAGSVIGVVLTIASIGVAANVVCDDGSRAISERSSLHNGMKVGTWSCSANTTAPSSNSSVTGNPQKARTLNLCSASCTTHCGNLNSNGTGASPYDCRVLANYYATSGRFLIKKGRYIIWAYGTCKVTQYNHLRRDISYCYGYHHWAGVVNYIASHCHRPEHPMAGSCYFYADGCTSNIVVDSL